MNEAMWISIKLFTLFMSSGVYSLWFTINSSKWSFWWVSLLTVIMANSAYKSLWRNCCCRVETVRYKHFQPVLYTPLFDKNTLFTFSQLADAFIQSDLQMRTMEAIKINKRAICKWYKWHALHPCSQANLYFKCVCVCMCVFLRTYSLLVVLALNKS